MSSITVNRTKLHLISVFIIIKLLQLLNSYLENLTNKNFEILIFSDSVFTTTNLAEPCPLLMGQKREFYNTGSSHKHLNPLII